MLSQDSPERTGRVVVCALGGGGESWELPPSSFVQRTWIYGGERTLYEVATAASALGYEVELRGDLSRRDLDEISEAAGARPRVGLGPRRAEAEDLVILPEADLPLSFARISMSPARAAVMLMAPPGLFGPPLVEEFEPADPLTVDRAALSRAESYRALSALGFEIWTNSPGNLEDSLAAGVPCAFLGTGQPIPFPDPGTRTHDVAFVSANRWAPLAREVVDRLSVRCLEIGESDRPGLVRALAAAKLLVLPARVEGQSRLQQEARAVGTVPVALRSKFAAGLNEKSGALVVDSLDEMPAAIERLLARPEELQERSARGMRTARAQLAWDSYVARVGEVLAAPPPEDGAWEARAALGSEVGRLIRELTERAEALGELGTRQKDAIGWLQGVVERAETGREALGQEVKWLRELVASTEEHLQGASAELEALRARRSVRAALRLADLTRWLPGRRRP